MSKIVRCISTDGLVMAAAIDSTDIVKEAARVHHTTPVMTSALGRLLTGASIMGSMLKEEKASMTIRIKGEGPAGALIAVAESNGNVRGYAENPGLLIMPDENKNLNVRGAVGSKGVLSVIKDFGSGEPYVGQIPLASGEIAEDLAYYYGISEQIPTVFALGVNFDEKWNFSRAGGCFIQLLPAADEREILKVEECIKHIKPITQMLAEGFKTEEICRAVLPDFELEVLDEFEVEYHCPCSLDRVYRSLATLSSEDIETLAGEDGYAEVCCHFCDAVYNINQEELNALAEAKRNEKLKVTNDGWNAD
ncbi:MAG: Hsp33 family molecular chaperone HslO [Oscillospiraceae bacterium]|nr:Hsp33 family molecular chaperone HslO [Oscillospiraceae bacterium]